MTRNARIVLASLSIVIVSAGLFIGLREQQHKPETSGESAEDLREMVAIQRQATPPFDGQPRREVPEHASPDQWPDLPERPTDAQIAGARLFPTRLWPIGDGEGGDSQNAAAGVLLRQLREIADKEERFTALEEWLAANSDSRWHPALSHELASHRFERGYFEEARALWDAVWGTVRKRTDLDSHYLGNEVLGRLLDANIGIARADRLRDLIADAEGRTVPGATDGKLHRARQVLWMLEHTGVQNIVCGPLALNCIKDYFGQPYSPPRLGTVTADYIATGIPLSEVKRYAEDHYGLEMDAFLRPSEPEQPIPSPSVAHTSEDHFLAVLEISEDGEEVFIEDRSLGFAGWIDREAFEGFSTGYFLAAAEAVPEGWNALADAESRNVFGRDGAHPPSETGSATTERSPVAGGSSDCDKYKTSGTGSSGSGGSGGGGGGGGGWGMAVYTFHPFPGSLRVTDVPVGYSPPVGPGVGFKINYNDLDDSAPASPPVFSNVGLTWSTDWVAWVEHVRGSLTENSQLRVHPRGGGVEISTYDTAEGRFGPNDRSYATVTRTGSHTYTRRFSDGSVEIYDAPDDPANPDRVFLTEYRDRSGNSLQFSYDANNRLQSVTDTIGQVTVLRYEHPTDIYKITSVDDPFGRQALLDYNGAGELIRVTDQIGLESSFTYDPGGLLATITTPYGTTTIEKVLDTGAGVHRALEVTDPLGDKERVEQYDVSSGAPEIASLTPPSGGATVNGEPVPFYAENARLQWRNSYYWDKEAMHQAPGDYSAARNYRFFTDRNWKVVPILEAVKQPLEDRVWYNYPGAEESQEAANGWPAYPGIGSHPEKTLRMLSDGSVQMLQTYTNERGNVEKLVDPVGRTTEFNYASNGVDLLSVRQTSNGIDDLLVSATYDGRHRPLTETDAAGQTTTYTYNARGQLLTATNALNETTAFTYDQDGFLLNVNGPLPGNIDVTAFTYDAVGRVRTVTEPDGYSLFLDYDDFDRLTRATFPDSSFDEFTYDRLDRVSHRDRLGRTRTFTYDDLRRVIAVTDPANRTFQFDWCRCGDLRSLTDPMGRRTAWNRDIQGRVIEKEFPDGSSVQHIYDSSVSRLIKRVDEKGQITVYDYNLDNTLRRRSFPNAANATAPVEFEYDPNYRRTTRMHDGIGTTDTTFYPVGVLGANNVASEDGPWSDDTITYQYDAVGRLVSRGIDGIAETVSFDEGGRVQSMTNPLGVFSYTYVGGTGRMADSTHANGLKTVYSYLPNAQDRRMNRIRHLKPDGTTPISEFTYTFDAIGRILTWRQQIDNDVAGSRVWTLGYDQADQLASVQVSQGGSVIKTYGWTYDDAGNRLTETEDGVTTDFQYNVSNQLIESSANLTNATHEWNAEDRLIAWNSGNHRSEFAYDGLGRCRIIREWVSGAKTSEKTFVWDGLMRRQQRDETGDTVAKQFFGEGIDVNGDKYYYTRDHLGSVREVVDDTGTTQQRVGYAPWGTPDFSAMGGEKDFGFTGHFFHEASGLHLAPFRAYQSDLGRWMSRDPIGENGGINLYHYAMNSPVNFVDPTGEYYLIAIYIGFKLKKRSGRFVQGQAKLSNRRCPMTLAEFKERNTVLATDGTTTTLVQNFTIRDDRVTGFFKPDWECGEYDIWESPVMKGDPEFVAGEGFECAYSLNGLYVPDKATWNEASPLKPTLTGPTYWSIGAFIGHQTKDTAGKFGF